MGDGGELMEEKKILGGNARFALNNASAILRQRSVAYPLAGGRAIARDFLSLLRSCWNNNGKGVRVITT